MAKVSQKSPPSPHNNICLFQGFRRALWSVFSRRTTWFPLSLRITIVSEGKPDCARNLSLQRNRRDGFYFFRHLGHPCTAGSRSPITLRLFYFYKPLAGFAPRLERSSIPAWWYLTQECDSLLPEETSLFFSSALARAVNANRVSFKREEPSSVASSSLSKTP